MGRPAESFEQARRHANPVLSRAAGVDVGTEILRTDRMSQIMRATRKHDTVEDVLSWMQQVLHGDPRIRRRFLAE